MPPAKKYRVKVRMKTRNRVVRRTGFVLAALACFALVLYGGFRVVRFAGALRPVNIFAFNMKNFEVRASSDVVSGAISEMLEPGRGRRFSAADAERLELVLRERFPSLSRVEVRRSLIGGRVTVQADPEPLVAKVRLKGGRDFYLAENGRLLKETYGPLPSDEFTAEIHVEPKERPAALAGFLKEFKLAGPEFASRPVSLVCRGADGPCSVKLENSAEVFWGGFEFTRTKIARLNEVLEDAAKKIKGPLKVDFRYFSDGKVFVSKAGNI